MADSPWISSATRPRESVTAFAANFPRQSKMVGSSVQGSMEHELLQTYRPILDSALYLRPLLGCRQRQARHPQDRREGQKGNLGANLEASSEHNSSASFLGTGYPLVNCGFSAVRSLVGLLLTTPDSKSDELLSRYTHIIADGPLPPPKEFPIPDHLWTQPSSPFQKSSSFNFDGINNFL